MPRTSEGFRRSGSFDMTERSPAVLQAMLKNLCFAYGIDRVQSTLSGLANEFGFAAQPEAARDGAAPGRSRRKSRRSEGADQAWVTRRAVKRYMEDNPGVTKDEAMAHVKEVNTRVTADEPKQETRHRKAMETKAQEVIEEHKRDGRPLPSMAEARKIVSSRMRSGEKVNKKARKGQQPNAEQQPNAAPSTGGQEAAAAA